MRAALLFPGQGSQEIKMGKNLYDNFSEARAVIDEVDDALGRKLSTIMFEGPEQELTKTENAQPALMAVSIAKLAVIKKKTGLKINQMAEYVAGHSLGEFTALCAAGSISLSDTAKILETRGQAMQNAVAIGEGAMVAIIGTNIQGAAQIALQAAEQASSICEVANNNGAGQVVLSGTVDAIDMAIKIAKGHGNKAILLNVSAPFHCALIKSAAEHVEKALQEINMKKPKVPVVSNVSAMPVTDINEIKSLLIRQIYSTVYWEETINFLIANGINNLIEIGSGSVLTRLNKRMSKSINAVSSNNMDDVLKVIEHIKEDVYAI